MTLKHHALLAETLSAGLSERQPSLADLPEGFRSARRYRWNCRSVGPIGVTISKWFARPGVRILERRVRMNGNPAPFLFQKLSGVPRC